jgi:hypothetical protein
MVEHPLEDLIEVYIEQVKLLRRSVQGMNNRHARMRPIPGKWSTLEVLCHLADMECVFAERMRRVITEERPPLPNADENAYQRMLGYNERFADEELEVIKAVRQQMSRILSVQDKEIWKRVGIHSEVGELSLEDLVRKCVSHMAHHVKFIEDKRRAMSIE